MSAPHSILPFTSVSRPGANILPCFSNFCYSIFRICVGACLASTHHHFLQRHLLRPREDSWLYDAILALSDLEPSTLCSAVLFRRPAIRYLITSLASRCSASPCHSPSPLRPLHRLQTVSGRRAMSRGRVSVRFYLCRSDFSACAGWTAAIHHEQWSQEAAFWRRR